jgi:hypothetical protein
VGGAVDPRDKHNVDFGPIEPGMDDAATKMQAVRIVLCPIVALEKQPLNLLGDPV